jgi:hypothetical protein
MRGVTYCKCERCGLSLKIIADVDIHIHSTAACRCGHAIDCSGTVLAVFSERREAFLVDGWKEVTAHPHAR